MDKKIIYSCFGKLNSEDDEDDDEIAYFTMRWKTRELVLSTAPKTWDNTDKDSKDDDEKLVT